VDFNVNHVIKFLDGCSYDDAFIKSYAPQRICSKIQINLQLLMKLTAN